MARTKLETASYWATIGMFLLAIWLAWRPPASAVLPPQTQPQEAKETAAAVGRANPRPLYAQIRWLVSDPRFWTIIGLVAAAGLHVLAVILKKQRPEEPYPVVAIYVHLSARGSEVADRVRSLFEKAGWRVNVFGTEVSRHTKGVWVHGGTDAERHIAEWGLRTVGIIAETDYFNDNPPSLQVIVGAYESQEPQSSGEDIEEEVKRNQILRDYPNVVAARDTLKRVLEATQSEREAIRGILASEISVLKNQRDGMEQAWLTCKRAFGIQRLIWFADRVKENVERHNADKSDDKKLPPVRVTIRFVGYSANDSGLAKRIADILKEHTNWVVTLDGGNNPALMPHDEFKVIFVSGAMDTFRDVAAAFYEGRLVDAAIGGRADPNDFEQGKLTIEVLPTETA